MGKYNYHTIYLEALLSLRQLVFSSAQSASRFVAGFLCRKIIVISDGLS